MKKLIRVTTVVINHNTLLKCHASAADTEVRTMAGYINN